METAPDDGRARGSSIDAALATGDVPGALRAWHETYAAALNGRRWEGVADAGDAYLRIARASGSPSEGISRARDLYLSALSQASRSGSLEGVLRLASAFVDLGDDEVATHSLRIARQLAGVLPSPAPASR
jgi:hypothetical protein